MVLDLPYLSPVVNLDYLRALLKKNCPYFKITREETRTLPSSKYRRRFDSKKTLQILERVLAKKGKKPSGFN